MNPDAVETREPVVAVPVILDEDVATATPVETVTLGADVLHAALEANATTTIDAHLRTAAVDLSAEERRAPLDVVVALDRSGSMSGAKLALCQETIALLIRELRSDDRFALVSFDHTVKREMDLASMDGDGAKARAEACAHRVKSGGTTNLSGGLLEALQIAADASGAPAVATPVTDDPPPPRRPSAREALSTAITSLFGRDADGAVADGAVKEEAAAVAPPPGAPPKARVRAVMLLTDGHMNAGFTGAGLDDFSRAPLGCSRPRRWAMARAARRSVRGGGARRARRRQARRGARVRGCRAVHLLPRDVRRRGRKLARPRRGRRPHLARRGGRARRGWPEPARHRAARAARRGGRAQRGA